MKIKTLLVAALLASGFVSFAQVYPNHSATGVSTELCIRDFGAVPDSGKDAGPAFKEAFEACRNKGIHILRLGKGRYDIYPESATSREIFVSNTSSESECPSKFKNIGLLIEDIDGLTIEGDGAQLIFHGKQTMMAVIHSKNICIKNLEIDCKRPGGSEMVVEVVESQSVTLRFKKDSWYKISPEKKIELVGEGWKTEHPHCIEFDPESGHMCYSDNWSKLMQACAVEIKPGLVRFEISDTQSFKVGNTLTVRDHIRDEVGILNLESENITLSGLGVHYLHAIGVISQFCHNVTVENSAFEPSGDRILASSADFLHFSGCSGKVTVSGCRFSGAQDDPINVHGTYLALREKISPQEAVLRFMHHQTYGMQAFWPGDTVSFVNANSLQTKSVATVESVERLSDREVRLRISGDVPGDASEEKYVVENLSRTPEVEITDNFFTRTSTRGTLVTTPRKVVISGNTYLKTGMSAIFISGDANDWYESGAVKDVLIENNRFIDCAYNGSPGGAVISIEPTNTVDSSPVHGTIRITDNYFDLKGKVPVYSKSVANLVFENNSQE